MGKQTSAYNSDRYVSNLLILLAALRMRCEVGSKEGKKGVPPEIRSEGLCVEGRRALMFGETRTELTSLTHRFVRPTFAVSPANVTK